MQHCIALIFGRKSIKEVALKLALCQLLKAAMLSFSQACWKNNNIVALKNSCASNCQHTEALLWTNSENFHNGLHIFIYIYIYIYIHTSSYPYILDRDIWSWWPTPRPQNNTRRQEKKVIVKTQLYFSLSTTISLPPTDGFFFSLLKGYFGFKQLIKERYLSLVLKGAREGGHTENLFSALHVSNTIGSWHSYRNPPELKIMSRTAALTYTYFRTSLSYCSAVGNNCRWFESGCLVRFNESLI